MALGLEFASESNALANILVDHVYFVGGRLTANDPITSINPAQNGKMNVLPYGLPNESFYISSGDITASGAIQLGAAIASTRRYITHLSVMNSHATVGTVVRFSDGADGTNVFYQGYAGAVGGGFSVTLPQPIRCSLNSVLNVRALTAGSNLYVNVIGYTNAL
jgi:hypothetical protein